jgi:hypothetical protein
MEWHMNLDKTLASAVVVAALSLPALPAGAQDRNGHQRGGGRATASQPAQRSDGGRQAAARQAPREAAPQARPAAPPPSSQTRQYSQAAPRSYSQAGPGAYSQAGPRSYAQASPRSYAQASPRSYAQAPGAYSNRAVPRSNGGSYQSAPYRGSSGNGYRNDGGRAYAAPRSYGYPSQNYSHGYYGGSHSYYQARPYYGHAYVRPYGWTAYRPYYFGRAYYSFSPWFSIGFGLWSGYPVTYPWSYYGTYRPHVYGYYDNTASYDVAPGGVPIYGGLSFDIQPSDADLFVDGEFVGTVGTFTPNGEPLTLTPGQHRIAVQREGYRAMEWDVTIEPGKVVPYRGAMQR